jgi:hypothetical protein
MAFGVTVVLALTSFASAGAAELPVASGSDGGGVVPALVDAPSRRGCGDAVLLSSATYVSMGDSYSAGEGMNCYFAVDGNDRIDGCHRSRKSWAVGWLPGSARKFVACTGAVSENVHLSRQDRRGATIQALALSPSVTGATISIGGNDAFFGDIVRSCLTLVVDQRIGPDLPLLHVGERLPGSTGTCSELLAKSERVIADELPGRLTSLYRALLARADGVERWRRDAPTGSNRQFRLVVVTYPDLFPSDLRGTASWPETGRFCRVANLETNPNLAYRLGFGSGDVRRFRALQNQLNQTIRDAVGEIRAGGDTRIRIADAATRFPDRANTCGREGQPAPFINGIFLSPAFFAKVTECTLNFGVCIKRKFSNAFGEPVSAASFHLTGRGNDALAGLAQETISPNVALSILKRVLPRATPGVDYSTRIGFVGGSNNATFTLTSGALPQGLTLARDGFITGTPAPSAATSTFAITATSGTRTASRTLTLSVAAAPTAAVPSLIDAGYGHNCRIRDTGTVVCWGSNVSGQTTAPAGTFAAVSAGDYHTCGVRTTGTIACWGNSGNGETTPPPGLFTSVSAGNGYTCGIRDIGTIACWGENDYGQTTAPAGTFTAVSAGGEHTCGLRTTGTIACWGSDFSGEAIPPAGTFTAVSAGHVHTCGIRTTGTIACWGSDGDGQATPPSGTFTAVSAGYLHTCGIRTSGTIACWGRNWDGQATPPAGTFTVVIAGGHYSCGLHVGDVFECWGRFWFAWPKAVRE